MPICASLASSQRFQWYHTIYSLCYTKSANMCLYCSSNAWMTSTKSVIALEFLFRLLIQTEDIRWFLYAYRKRVVFNYNIIRHTRDGYKVLSYGYQPRLTGLTLGNIKCLKFPLEICTIWALHLSCARQKIFLWVTSGFCLSKMSYSCFQTC